MPSIYSVATAVASSVPFDNSTNSFAATDVQAAIEEARGTSVSSQATATANTTTTSTTDVLINTMTLTPASGTYMVWFTTSIDSNTNNSTVSVSIYAAGAQVAASEVHSQPQFQGGLTPSLNVTIPYTAIARIAVNGSQAIEARWRISSGTATAHQRTLMVLKVA